MNARKRVGQQANHLKFDAYDGAASLPSIAFRCAGIEELLGHDAAVDIAYQIEVARLSSPSVATLTAWWD